MATYTIGSLSNLISGKKDDQSTATKVVYNTVKPQEKRKKPFKSESSDADQSSSQNSGFKTLTLKAKKIKSKLSFAREKFPEIAGDDKKRPVGKSLKYISEEGNIPSVDTAVENEPVSSFSRNAERRVAMKKNKKKHVDDPEREARTIFVGNIPLAHSNKDKISKHFSAYGKVESVRLRCAPLKDPRMSKKVAVIKNEYHPDRNNINAYVVFASPNEAKNALQSNGTVFHDNHLRVDMAGNGSDSQNIDVRKSIFLGNLAFGAEEEDLWEMFSSCGEITSIRVIRDQKTGVGKGIAYVNFASADAVELALEMNGNIIKKRPVIVKRYHRSNPSVVSAGNQVKKPRYKGSDSQGFENKSTTNLKEKRRLEKKEIRRQRRLAEANQSNSQEKEEVVKTPAATEASKKKTKSGRQKAASFLGQKVDKNRRLKKKVNKSEQKKKKISYLLAHKSSKNKNRSAD